MFSKTSLTTTTATAAVALSILGAAQARADSLAYVKGGDIYLSTTDGARQFQVTSGGGYEQVTQADDGTMMAVVSGNSHLRKLDRYGNVLADFPVPVSDHSPGALRTFQGPFNIDVSPNGQKAGYGYYESGFYQDPTTGHISASSNNGTAFTKTDSESGFTDDGYKYAKSWDAPEFVDNDNVLMSFGPSDSVNDPIATMQVGSGNAKSWFNETGYPHPMEAAISRNKRVIAYVGGPDRTELRVLHDTNGKLGFDPATDDFNVESCFSYKSDAGAKDFANPTFNADGSRGFWVAEGAIQTAAFNMTASGPQGCGQGQSSVKIIDGGTSPDWGPADVPTSRPAAPAPSAAASGSQVAPVPANKVVPVPAPAPINGGHTAGGALSIKAPHSSLRKALKSGLTIAVGGTGAIRATATSAGKVVGRGTAAARANTVRIVFSTKAKKALRKAGAAKLTIRVVRGVATGVARVTLKK